MKCEREKVRGRGSERKETQFPEVAERLLGSCDLPNYSATVTAAVEDGNTPYRRYKSPVRAHTLSPALPLKQMQILSVSLPTNTPAVPERCCQGLDIRLTGSQAVNEGNRACKRHTTIIHPRALL